MSDGGRERPSRGMEVWKSSQKQSVQRSAVRSIAWLGRRLTEVFGLHPPEAVRAEKCNDLTVAPSARRSCDGAAPWSSHAACWSTVTNRTRVSTCDGKKRILPRPSRRWGTRPRRACSRTHHVEAPSVRATSSGDKVAYSDDMSHRSNRRRGLAGGLARLDRESMIRPTDRRIDHNRWNGVNDG